MFLIQVLLTTQPYMRIDIVGKGEYTYLSVLKMLSLIGAHNDNGQYMSSLSNIGLWAIIFIALPVVALGFQLFDFHYNLKNIVGFFASAVGIVSILYLIGPAFIGSGSLIAIIIYIITAFASVMGMMARVAKVEDKKIKEVYQVKNGCRDCDSRFCC